jgi:hypothetical protein
LGIAVLLLAGCAAPIVAVRSASAPEQPYRRLVVAAPLTNSQARAEVENAFVEVLVGRSVVATASASLVPPTRAYTSEELLARLREPAAQAVLVITLPDAYPAESDWSTMLAQLRRGDLPPVSSGGGGQSRAAVGYAPHSGLLSFELKLLDLTSEQEVWSGKTRTPLSEYPLTRLDRTYRWVARKAVARLHQDGFVP